MNVGKKDQNYHTSIESSSKYCKLFWLSIYISGNHVTDQSSHCSCGCGYGWYNPASNQLCLKSVHILDGVHGRS